MVELIDTQTCADRLNVSRQVIVGRIKKMGVGRLRGGKWWINPDEFEAVTNYKKSLNNQNTKYSKKKIHIIDFFLTHSCNGSLNIANCLDINVSRVEATLNEYFNNQNHIIVESKLNNLN